MNVIDAAMFRAMLRSGAIDLQRHSDEVNNLNVFPVPDGDTGVNMFATLRGGVEAVESLDASAKLGDICKALSRGMLLAARGNSGVILSQFFAGLAEKLSDHETANVLQFSQAFESGVKRAYEVVVKPVEGTILTVMREGGEYAASKIDSTTSFAEYFTNLIFKMRDSLQKTPELLPVLKEAGVIDSGGAGLLYIVEGMAQAIGGKIIEDVSLHLEPRAEVSSYNGFDENSTLEYGYCTEFILQLTNQKEGVKTFSLDEAIAFYQSIGDSLVAFQDGTLVKVHVHTKVPDQAIAYALRYGEFVRFKMENMTLQHSQTMIEKSKHVSMMARPESVPQEEIALLAVTPNKETQAVYREYGVAHFLNGGPYMNPDAQAFVDAFRECNAKSIILFPNNKNEVMVASSAAKMCEDIDVRIIPTDDIAEGLSVCSVLDVANLSLQENVDRATAALRQCNTFMAFQAGRDTVLNGAKIQAGDYLAGGKKDGLQKGESAFDCFKSWYEKQEGEHGLLIVLASSSVDESVKDAIRDLCESGGDFMDILFYDIGDYFYEMYAILD